jgi:hypothetical protein
MISNYTFGFSNKITNDDVKLNFMWLSPCANHATQELEGLGTLRWYQKWHMWNPHVYFLKNKNSNV